VMLRVLLTSFADKQSMSWSSGWPPVLAAIAVATMTVANLIAGRQDSVKRMLAYSSIAHAGYILVGVVSTLRAPSHDAAGSVLFYLLAYTVSTAGAFGALILCGSRGAEAVSYEDLAGIGRRHPAAALPFALFMVSLAGVPPTAGFFGKWFIFKAAMEGGFYWLTIIAFVNSVIGAYYYLRVIVVMYMREPSAETASTAVARFPLTVNLVLTIAAVGTVYFGLFPNQILNFVLQSNLLGR
jgi:NADH-quinone oxidoreductase subunit N